MRNRLTLTAAAISLFMLSGCGEPEIETMQPPAPTIDVATVSAQNVQNWFTYTTRLESPEIVALRPRVSGIVDSIEFTEGQQVNEGDLLFRLDARPFAAEVNRLKAQIVSAEAALSLAESEEKRAVRLSKHKAISEEQAENRIATAQQKRADLLALRSALRAAELDLTFTDVRSPITGIISRAEITRGNTVIAGQSMLTSIVSNQKMYAYFNIDERTWNQEFNQLTPEAHLPVLLNLAGTDQYRHTGEVDFIDNAIDASTGTLRVRATFSQQQATLKAGAFARVRLAADETHSKVLIPTRSIGTDLKNNFVLTVNNDDVLEYRLIEVGERFGRFSAINTGLRAGDRIAVNGPAKVGPGMPVVPNNVDLDLSSLQLTLKDNLANDTLMTARQHPSSTITQ